MPEQAKLGTTSTALDLPGRAFKPIHFERPGQLTGPKATSAGRWASIAHCQIDNVSGRYWARTSDPQLVELVLSQLS